jgi:hypothetical protein
MITNVNYFRRLIMARDNKVMVRLDDKELARLERLAKRTFGESHLKLGAYLRFLLGKAK